MPILLTKNNINWSSLKDWPQDGQGGHFNTTPPQLEHVRSWIADTLSVMPQDILLTEIFALRPSSVTASFQIANTQTRVIFKANRVPLFFKSAHVHLQLQECCPQAVPKLIHHQIDTSGLWMLFDPIIGKSVQDLGNHSGLIQMAKTIANIQIAFAKHLKSQTADLPRFQHQIPEMLDFLVKRIQDCYLPLWTKR